MALLDTESGAWCRARLSTALGAATAQLAIVRHSMRPLLARRRLTNLLHFEFEVHAEGLVDYVALNEDVCVVRNLDGSRRSRVCTFARMGS